MHPGFLARRLAGPSRLLLILTAVWVLVGVLGSYSRLQGVWQWQIASQLSVELLWGIIAGVVAWTIVRHQQRSADYGFSFQTGGLASLAILAVIHGYLMLSGKLVLSAPENAVWKALGAFMEEIAFRVIAIDTLILLMKGS